jgi:hypothetical protein
MANEIVIRVVEVVGSGLCVALEDGQKVYDQIVKVFKEQKKVKLLFTNIDTLTSAFLNAAIGQLYGSYSEQLIRDSLNVDEIEADDRILLTRVIENSKIYYKNPGSFTKARKEALGEEDE